MRFARIAGLAPALAAVLVTSSVAPARAAVAFVHETVDSTGYLGEDLSFALDAAGRPHLSYFDQTNGDLRYATRDDAGRWRHEVVDAAGFVGQHTSVALDASGSPGISYFDGTNSDLKFASRGSNGVWATVTVDATGSVGTETSLAFDDAGNPRIAYYDGTNDDLKYASRNAAGAWTLEVAASAGDVGRHASLSLDHQGHPRIACYDATNGMVLASRGSGAWSLQLVDPGPTQGTHCSLALDAAGSPCLVYVSTVLNVLRYTVLEGDTWITQLLDGGAAPLLHASLALDHDGNPHVAYYDEATSDLRYAKRVGAAWSLQTVAADGTAGLHAKLALDAEGNPHIAYFDEARRDLLLASSSVRLTSPLGGEHWAAGSEQTVRWAGPGAMDIELSLDGGFTYTVLRSGVGGGEARITVPEAMSAEARIRLRRADPPSTSESPGTFAIAPDLTSPWWREIAASAGNNGLHLSLALDALGRPHVAQYNPGALRVEYLNRSGGAWQTEIVDASSGGLFTSIALDPAGEPRVSYYHSSTGDLRCAFRTAGGGWTVETVDSLVDAGGPTSLRLDAAGEPRIAYYNSSQGDLMFASRSGGAWTRTTVDATGTVGNHASLALDAAGQPRISYYDQTGFNLKFASRDVYGTWTLGTVDTAGTVGLYTSLALDRAGNPHIAYYDLTAQDLKLASRDPAGVWAVERVDMAANVGTYASLALDAGGSPRIAYRDAGRLDLKFARRLGRLWAIETVDSAGSVGPYCVLALDAGDNARIAYQDAGALDLRYASSALELSAPGPGATWPVGAAREVSWRGAGRAAISLSVDGGASWQPLASGLAAGSYRFDVPHAPTRFAKLRLERAVPRSVAVSPMFTIETSVALLDFTARPVEGGTGADLSWRSDPGPGDLAGYRIERDEGAAWRVVASLVTATSFHDPHGVPGSRYRLFAVNGLGEPLLLGEASLAPARPLAAWPLPYRGGELHVSFGASGALGGGAGEVTVDLFDLSGRLVRTLARGEFTAGYHEARWDGRDAGGGRVAPGVYFLRASGGGGTHRTRLVVLP